MKKFLLPIIVVIVYACGGNSSKEGMKETKMTAKIGSENYEVAVNYHLDEDNGLTVLSDKTDIADSNDDGLIFAIFEYNGKLQFDFVKNGERLGGRITDWNKTASDISGNGTLKPENGLGQEISVSFNLRL